MKSWIKSVVFFCLYYSGLEWLFARMIRVNAAAILMYHGVCDDAPMPAHINFHLDRDMFERQMRVLKRRYAIKPLSDVAAALNRGERVEKSVVLTFDDGYKNNASLAAPILNRLGMPYTVYVVTAYISSGKWMPLNEVYWMWSQGKLTSQEMTELRKQLRQSPSADVAKILATGVSPPKSEAAEQSFAMMTWDEVRELARNGAEIGSHTHSHCNMAVENEAQQGSELLVSNQLIEKYTGTRVRSFAYPYGYTSEVAFRTVRDADYDCAVSTESGLATQRSDKFRLPRIGFDRRIWMFTGEILYQFAKQAARDFRRKVIGDPLNESALAKTAGEDRG
jgi:peptidoglycan/xylan/chitin deacetylase (PgdA/CDA1 family)